MLPWEETAAGWKEPHGDTNGSQLSAALIFWIVEPPVPINFSIEGERCRNLSEMLGASLSLSKRGTSLAAWGFSSEKSNLIGNTDSLAFILEVNSAESDLRTKIWERSLEMICLSGGRFGLKRWTSCWYLAEFDSFDFKSPKLMRIVGSWSVMFLWEGCSFSKIQRKVFAFGGGTTCARNWYLLHHPYEGVFVQQEHCSFDQRHSLAHGIQTRNSGREGYTFFNYHYNYQSLNKWFTLY